MVSKNYDISNIVFIDDDKQSSILFKQTLKEEIKTEKIYLNLFESANDFLFALKTRKVNADTVFFNIDMSEIDVGIFMANVRTFDPNISIFLISTEDKEEYHLKAKSYGAAGFLKKPINFKAVRAILGQAIFAA
jgi:DNA-binding NtrC family response regulator